MEQIHHDAIERRWEIKYLAYPYSRWTIEEHDEEEENPLELNRLIFIIHYPLSGSYS